MDKQLDLLDKLFESSEGAESAIASLIAIARDLKYLYNVVYNLRGFFPRGDRRFNGLTDMMKDLEDTLFLLGIFMHVYNKHHPKYEDQGGFFEVDKEYWEKICEIKSTYINNDALCSSDAYASANRISTIFKMIFTEYNMGECHTFLKDRYSDIQNNLRNFADTFKEINNNAV